MLRSPRREASENFVHIELNSHTKCQPTAQEAYHPEVTTIAWIVSSPSTLWNSVSFARYSTSARNRIESGEMAPPPSWTREPTAQIAASRNGERLRIESYVSYRGSKQASTRCDPEKYL
ncbi:BZ3500_MvSof-1268-A1-R1_Chr5-3g08167 [Microbotryum saponariae]|uniref:BZ3500_MvSof-1268-A1-R1_Chr5-3g08167 protein n=1 Tax=Microbotryum saponariae TaxID=289078 RepID=A0A2X0NNZ2_9BASI|nr:BZ3500_MvSof-1268-A1-R1_Chr5-3g08167 [Microbotryum saponariae]SDA07926.1 BZ3501_MvSof-1269-A2-R1_Chr5-1g07311 [Microbotryum saponariae]